jgi:hypothetical protein
MSVSIVSDLTNPADLSPAPRVSALAAILATGLLRLRKPVTPPETQPSSAPENSGKSTPNQLAVSGTKSVTVQAG